MTGPECLRDRRIVLAALILVTNQQRDRRPRGSAFEHAGQNLDRVGLAPLRHMPRRSGLAPVKLTLDVRRIERHAGRATIDNAADRGTVRLAKRGDAKQRAERIAGHGKRPEATNRG